MSKIKSKHSHFHWIHLIAVFILGGYFILSKVNLAHALSNKNLVESFSQLYIFGVFFACLFLYIFSHDKFFPVAREIEKEERKKEQKYLKRYMHHGKVLSTFIIGAIGGPVFSALTTRMLLSNYTFKYVLVILTNIPSTILTVATSRGLIHLFNF